MKINLKLIVFAILGIFLVKISIADSLNAQATKSNQRSYVSSIN
jgi:hypothetical protein